MPTTLPACGFRPISNYVVVLLDSVPDKSDGGIIFAEVSIKPATTGVVIAAGEGLVRENGVLVPIGVRPGDRVRVSGYAQTDIEHDGQKFVVMREPEILFVEDDEQAG